MCIIAAKPAGIPLPDRTRIQNMWNGNDDGAGFMYVENGKVRIEKGFMKYKDFITAFDKMTQRLDPTATPIVMHFRITTHGGTCPENCHPFPITDNIGALKKLKTSADIGIAHNGIIPIEPRKGISDTMEYTATQLAPLKKALPRFYENQHAMLMVKNAIGSKMAFLTKEGGIYTIGDFIEDGGILYSNSSYKYDSRAYAYNYGYYGGWGSYDSFSAKPKKKGKAKEEEVVFDYSSRPLMWLDDNDIVIEPENNEMWEAYDFLIDEDGTVYEYNWRTDSACPLPGFRAVTQDYLPVRYNEESAILTYIGDQYSWDDEDDEDGGLL
jgi:hypothetical protein